MRAAAVAGSLGLLLAAACGGRAGSSDSAAGSDTSATVAVTTTTDSGTAGRSDTARPPGDTGSATATAPQRACEPVQGMLARDFRASSLAGRYRLRLVATGAARSAAGTLTLRAMPDSLRFAATPGGGVDSSVSHPLFGTSDVDLEMVGAVTAGDGASTDPMRPGALVVQWWTAAPSGGRSTDVVVRIGSEGNRRDTAPFDGAYTVLRVARADATGFAGVWESGVEGRKTTGHFCADRVGA